VGQPALARRAAHQPPPQGCRVGVDGLHILHGQLQSECRRNIRQRRQRILPHKGRQQLQRRHAAGTFFGEQQRRRGTVGRYLQTAVQHLHLHRRLQADKALPCLRRKTQILPRFFRVDPARRGLQAGIQGRQRKAACLIQSLLHQQIEFGQRMCRVRLCHAEIRP